MAVHMDILYKNGTEKLCKTEKRKCWWKKTCVQEANMLE